MQKPNAEPHKTLQAAIVGKEVRGFLSEQGLALDNDETKSAVGASLFGAPQDTRVALRKYFKLGERDGLRVVAHVLTFRALQM